MALESLQKTIENPFDQVSYLDFSSTCIKQLHLQKLIKEDTEEMDCNSSFFKDGFHCFSSFERREQESILHDIEYSFVFDRLIRKNVPWEAHLLEQLTYCRFLLQIGKQIEPDDPLDLSLIEYAIFNYKKWLNEYKTLGVKKYKKTLKHVSLERYLSILSHWEWDSKSYFTWTEKQYKLGLIEASYYLCKCYHEGIFIKKNDKKALTIAKKAYKEGFSSALGYVYEYGIGVNKDLEMAFKYYFEDASRKNPIGEYWVGKMQFHGNGVPLNKESGFHYLLQSAQQWFAPSLLDVSTIYRFGLVKEKNDELSFSYIQKAATVDSLEGINQLCVCYLEGRGTPIKKHLALDLLKKYEKTNSSFILNTIAGCFRRNYFKDEFEGDEETYLKKIDKKNASSTALFNIAAIQIKEKPEESFSLLQQAVAKDPFCVSACAGIYLCYAFGIGVKEDKKKAEDYLASLDPSFLSSVLIQAAFHLKNGRFFIKENDLLISLLCRAAQMNDDNAYNELGRCYAEGIVIEKDEKKAIEYYEKGAALKNKYSLFNLAKRYLSNSNCEEKIHLGINYLQLSTQKYYYKAQHLLGNCYLNGKGVEKDLCKATHYFSLSAKQSYGPSYYSLGFRYFNGEGIKKNIFTAIECFEKGSELQDELSSRQLGLLYLRGDYIERDIEKSKAYFLKAIDQHDDESLYYLGRIYMCMDDMENATKYLKMGYERHNKNASLCLGNLYLKMNKDASVCEAIRIFEELCSQNQAVGFANLGFCYLNGIGVDKDLVKAESLFQQSLTIQPTSLGYYHMSHLYLDQKKKGGDHYLVKAANMNHPLACYELACRYAMSKEIQDYDKKAFYYMQQAVYLFVEDAFLELGHFYKEGFGTRKNEEKAKNYYEECVRLFHNKDAYYHLARCYYTGSGVKEDQEKAFAMFQNKDFFKHDETLLEIGACYYFGHGTKKDEEKGKACFLTCYEKNQKNANHFKAAYYLGAYYFNQEPKNYSQAVHYFQESYDGKFHFNSSHLADCYFYGDSSIRDYKKAFQYYRQSEKEFGFPHAMVCLALCYQDGKGTLTDLGKAHYWFDMARRSDPKYEKDYNRFLNRYPNAPYTFDINE